MQSHKVGNFMTYNDILGLDLDLDARNWCIKLIIRNWGDRVRTMGIPNDMLCVRGQSPNFLVKRSTPHVQLSTPNILGCLLTLTLWPRLDILVLLGLLTKLRPSVWFRWSVELVLELYLVLCTFLLLVGLKCEFSSLYLWVEGTNVGPLDYVSWL